MVMLFFFFFFNDTATTEIYTLSLPTLFRSLQVGADLRRRDVDDRRCARDGDVLRHRSEEHTSELQSQSNLVCRLLLEKKKKKTTLLLFYYTQIDSLILQS